MKGFDTNFKIYAYKKYDIVDISFKVNEALVLTYRFTHENINDLFKGAFTKEGVNIKLNSGVKVYSVIKQRLDAVRITIFTNGTGFNLRYPINDFENLIKEYNQQMITDTPWDNYDPR